MSSADTGTEWYFGVPFPSKRKAVEAGKPEPKYKVGQRVLVVDARGGGKIGDTGPITKIEWSDSDDSFYYHINGLSDCAEGLFERRIELIIPPTFLPDTRVRLKRHVHRFAAGDMGTVTVANDENVGVLMDGGRYWSFKPDDLEAMPAPWGAPDCAGRNGEHKFKAGDVVRSKKFPGCMYTIEKVKTSYGTGRPYEGAIAYDYTDNAGWDREESIELVLPSASNDPAQPCIVIRQVDGQPRPSSWPHVHKSAADATKEAERLASVNPGKQFDVYQRVTGRVAEQHIEMKVA